MNYSRHNIYEIIAFNNASEMKILYLITKSNFGGAQRYVYDLAVAMKKLGNDVTVGFGGSGTLATKLTDAGVKTITIPGLERDINPFADLKTFFTLLDIFADNPPDIIHLNSSKMGGIGALSARCWNAVQHIEGMFYGDRRASRIIFTGHGWAWNEDRGDLSRFLIGIAHWVTIALAHETIAVSKKTHEQVLTLPFVWHKVSVVHNGIGPMGLLPKSQALEEIFGNRKDQWQNDTPLVVGTIAELHKNKGLSYAMEGLSQLKKQTTVPFVYVIVGEGEERTHLEALATKLELNEVVFFAGYKEDASRLLSAFDIFLLPSITEAFPYVILEAGNAGLPVVATSVGGIPEVIDDMNSGILIQSKNPGEITRALSHLIEKPERRKEFGDAIKAEISGKFHIDAMVKETLSIYERDKRKTL